ncbi:MAG TPA: RNA polymerase factor sigma-54 [Candidatus Ozemobacteraceae bacterium]|nr:RNA polymerase factor sigma-54 [Candidatus Ozemobacteraceae bacterium]
MDNSMKLGLSQKLTQTLKMTPEMQLAIKILQLNSIELKNQIEEVLETNPIVELDEKDAVSTEVPLDKLPETAADQSAPPPSTDFAEPGRQDYAIDWQKYIQDSESSEIRVSAGGYAGDEETTFENFTSKKSTLRDHLETQLREAPLNPTELKIGEYMIGLVDRNGYLRHSRDQIADLLKIDQAVVDRVIRAIQNMDPPGVGAFDLRECLLIQARDEGYHDDAVTAVIDRHLEHLAANKLPAISKETGFDIEEIQAAVEIIKSFNPKPGAAFPSGSDEVYVTPDVFIQKVDGEYVASLNERDVPRLRINTLYRDAMKNKEITDKATYEFIRSKLEAAKSFLRYVDKRKETILNVTRAIIEVQRDFLDFGILHLKPLTLQDVAGMAGVHESTVSRATSGKYAQTPRGLFELKFFFSGAARTQSGEDVSTLAVKRRIEDLVKQEDPAKPLSDSDIVTRLKADGIYIARRTVAKYRMELNILSSSTRKRA